MRCEIVVPNIGQRTRVAIGIPSGDQVQADFAMALGALCFDPGFPILLINAKSSLVTIGRNNCVALAQKDQCTHLLFLDSDMIFPNDTLKRLMAHKRDIVGTVYHRRTPPFDLHGITPEGGKADLSQGGLREMAFMPTGCLLIDMKIFDKLKKPYFREVADEVNGRVMGEDYTFSRMARDLGFTLWCDLDLSRQIGHIGQQVFITPTGQRPPNLQQHELNVEKQALEPVKVAA